MSILYIYPQVSVKSTFGANPDIQRDQLSAIEAKIKEKEAKLAAPGSFRGQKEVSRQELDIEKSMFRGTDRDSNDLSNLLTRRKGSATGDPNDPINHLPQMMADIEERFREKLREKRRRRRRKKRRGWCGNDGDGVDDDDEGNNVCDSGKEEDAEEGGVIIGCLTFEETTAPRQSEKSTGNPWSEKTSTGGSGAPSTASSSKSPTSHTRTDEDSKRDDDVDTFHTKPGSADGSGSGITVEDVKEPEPEPGPPESSRKVLRGHVEFLPVEYINGNRLSLEEIRKVPKFTNYEAGSPSNVSSSRVTSHRGLFCCCSCLVSVSGVVKTLI